MRFKFAAAIVFAFLSSAGLNAQTNEALTIDARAATTPFPHFWEKTFGSGRAVLALRDDYRKDLTTARSVTDLQSVRFHGIFNDDVGLYDPDRQTKNPGLAAEKVISDTVYNFSYIDHIYDGLLERNVRPFVELSFMPKKMSSDANALHPFWYHPNVAPPKNYADWDAMITAFAKHLIERYGAEEVSTWYFEVWNEPNLDFWGGRPNQPTYFELYDHTVRALKAVNSKLIVGGPSTAQAGWVPDFLAHTKQANIPVDFVSTHVYGNDTADNVLHTSENVPRDKMVCRAVDMVHKQILKSAYPKIPLIMSEYNASYANEPNVTDSIYMGPWLATTISQCDGMTDAMSYWTFSDVFEEQGVTRTPFYGGFGIIADDNIPKPALNAFAMLHHLGTQRLAIASKPEDAIATRSIDGSLALALWNYAAPYGEGATYTPPPTTPGPSKTITLTVKGVSANAAVQLWQLDVDHGNVLKTYDAMGRPATPSRKQIVELREAGKLPAPTQTHLINGNLTVTIPTMGLAVLLVK